VKLLSQVCLAPRSSKLLMQKQQLRGTCQQEASLASLKKHLKPNISKPANILFGTLGIAISRKLTDMNW